MYDGARTGTQTISLFCLGKRMNLLFLEDMFLYLHNYFSKLKLAYNFKLS